MGEKPRTCPRCGQTMMLEYRRFERIADMLWVWRCASCGHLAPAKAEPTAGVRYEQVRVGPSRYE